MNFCWDEEVLVLCCTGKNKEVKQASNAVGPYFNRLSYLIYINTIDFAYSVLHDSLST